jgi:hypothetical protein
MWERTHNRADVQLSFAGGARAGEAAGATAADPIHDTERTASDGAVAIQPLFRWFVGLNMDEPVWVATVFTKNRDRLLEGEIASLFFASVVAQARAADLLSDEHFSVDGTLIEAWASQKSLQRKDLREKPPPDDPGNPTVDFHGREAQQRNARINDRCRCTAGAQERRPRVEAGLLRQCAMENRNGLNGRTSDTPDTKSVRSSGNESRKYSAG